MRADSRSESVSKCVRCACVCVWWAEVCGWWAEVWENEMGNKSYQTTSTLRLEC